MLDLDTCKRLKAAGLPQSAAFAYFEGWNEEGPLPTDGTALPVAVACPNSDELIAQIQAEFPPDIAPYLAVSLFLGGRWQAVHHAHGRKPPSYYPHRIVPGYLTKSDGTSLVAALANLYIALKEQA